VAKDPERAIKFYEKTLGWWFMKWDGPMEYWLVMTGKDPEAGIDGGMSIGDPVPGTSLNTIDVSSVDETVAKIEDAGGKIIRPKSAVPGVGWMAVFEDTEGNHFGMMERDTEAK
jgi:predicted enzyme related to lactoylglutathione lyase